MAVNGTRSVIRRAVADDAHRHAVAGLVSIQDAIKVVKRRDFLSVEGDDDVTTEVINGAASELDRA